MSNLFSIQKLNSNDNLELCELFGNAYNADINDRFINSMFNRFSDNTYATYGYKHNDILIAATHILTITSMGYASLERIGVLTDKQRQGIGLSLLKDVLEVLKNTNIQTVNLECRPHLLSFYEKVGFEPTKIEEHHIDNRGRDAGSVYTMKMNLR